MLLRRYRLTKAWDFNRVKNKGVKLGGPLFSLGFYKNKLDYPRFGFIATKLIGKAYARHRAVRLLREAVRLNLSQISAGFDFVFLARPKIIGQKRQAVEVELLRLLGRMHLTAQVTKATSGF